MRCSPPPGKVRFRCVISFWQTRKSRLFQGPARGGLQNVFKNGADPLNLVLLSDRRRRNKLIVRPARMA